MRKLIVIGALAIGAAVTAPAQASEALPPAVAQHLDKAPVEFTWSAAAERRHMIMRSQRRGHGGYGRGYGYGPRPGYGYRRHGGPPPWAPAHGYRRHHRW